jgi:hypothetical protein
VPLRSSCHGLVLSGTAPTRGTSNTLPARWLPSKRSTQLIKRKVPVLELHSFTGRTLRRSDGHPVRGPGRPGRRRRRILPGSVALSAHARGLKYPAARGADIILHGVRTTHNPRQVARIRPPAFAGSHRVSIREN